jgi:hypothetical protein
VAIERGCDPGVRQLQQRSAAGTEKEGRLAIDLPTYGGWSEDPGLGIGGLISNGIPKTLDFPSRDGLDLSFHTLLDSMVVLRGRTVPISPWANIARSWGVPPIARA